MKFNEEEFRKEVESFNKEIEIIGKYKGLNKPILVKDKYGLLQINSARLLLFQKPTIQVALNKTEYFMNQLLDKQPEIYKLVKPLSEYTNARNKMLFETKYGIVSIPPDSLLSGHTPTIRVAINRKEYLRNQLLDLYDNKYDFKILSSRRKEGNCILICPIHGEQYVDTDGIFMGSGCPKCNREVIKSDLLYIIRLYNEEESFYKLGISHYNNHNDIARFKSYKLLGYNIEILYTKQFNDYIECRNKETELKQIIKPFIYMPKHWENNNTTECFHSDLIKLLIDKLI